jgi:bifunctional N-acetylglucosamine-1-phosphate-uridyltransferase/glucosamine-1-phosphate-acetyltransferase GlmU-like protein
MPITEPKGSTISRIWSAWQWPRACQVEVVTIDDVTEVQGINTRAHLARSRGHPAQRIAECA